MRMSALNLIVATFLFIEAVEIKSADLFIRRGASVMVISSRTQGSQTTKSFLSPNGQYRVVLEDAEAPIPRNIDITAAMTKVANPNPSVLWRKTTKSLPVGFLRPEDVVVSDDGEFFLLAATDEQWILFRKHYAPEKLATPPPPHKPPLISNHQTAMPDDLIAIDRIETRPIVRIWHANTDKWEAFRADTNEKFEITDDLLLKWNTIQRGEILKKIERLRKDGMRRKVGDFAPKLSQMATNFVPQVQFGDIRDIDYQFLALRRIPEDREIFREMLMPHSIYTLPRPAAFSHTMFMGYRSSRLEPFFQMYDFQRLRGDTLLALFEQKASRTNLAPSSLWRPQFYLGRAYGRVHLPVPIGQRTGPLRVWLVPQDQIKKDWAKAGAEFMEADLQNHRDRLDDLSEISFQFVNVTPGQYLLKSIWDKRPTYEDIRQAGPGDYESSWLGPITITAGNTTSNLYSLCTNRVSIGGGDTYYAADDLFLRMSSKSK